MPSFPIIDTHLHIWDFDRLNYSAFAGHPLFGKSYQIEDYQRDCGDLEVEAMVFLECYADFTPESGQYLEEIAFVEDSAKRDPRIKGIVPMAPLERGDRVRPLLEEMKAKHPDVKGIRRIVEFDDDPRGLTLSDSFVEGVNLLGDFGYHFEINVNHTQMDIVREFVKRVPDVPLILDHCGKPGIAEGAIDQYRDDVAVLSRHENLWIKLSDLPVEADHQNWTDADLRPYIDATFDAFGFDRTIYAGDYPICLQATTLPRWVDVLDRALAGVPEVDLRKFYRDNANAFYRLGL
ncbi:amidohydrolase family protein [Mariluticola halotolerans]|uniref:amidohydrolase family protein n=1 Tax=Mariluticola halotolerans TaxID=2909283 RepID=UPI0026E356CE|nr:amidohydrolase family protein [Mariluticola halotolerans]UJQ94286.1 amidohydrolase family protein [Mariluticola halotolerans]